MQQPQGRHRAIEFVVEEAGLEAEVAGKCAMQPGAERRAGVIIAEKRLAEIRQAGPRVEGTEGPSGQKVGVVRRDLQTDVESLLHVGSPPRIERFVQHPGIAPISADPLDRQSLPFGQRQSEKAPGLVERASDQIAVDAVIDDIKKAHVPAGGAGFGLNSGQRVPIALAP